MDEIITDAPWVITEEFINLHKIDFVTHDALPYSDSSGQAADVYDFVRSPIVPKLCGSCTLAVQSSAWHPSRASTCRSINHVGCPEHAACSFKDFRYHEVGSGCVPNISTFWIGDLWAAGEENGAVQGNPTHRRGLHLRYHPAHHPGLQRLCHAQPFTRVHAQGSWGVFRQGLFPPPSPPPPKTHTHTRGGQKVAPSVL